MLHSFSEREVLILKDRIKKLRKELNLNQTEFGERIGVKQGSVAGYESGARTPLDAVISSICKAFNVNEIWLRTGEGEMFIEMDKEAKLMSWAGSVLKSVDDSFKKRFVKMLSELNEKDWETLEKIALKLHEKKD